MSEDLERNRTDRVGSLTQNHHSLEPNNIPIVNECMRLFLLCIIIILNFQSFGQHDSLNAVICQAIQNVKKPQNSIPIYYFPFYNGIQLIEVDYFTYSQRDHVTRFVKPSKDSLWYSKHVHGEQTEIGSTDTHLKPLAELCYKHLRMLVNCEQKQVKFE
jgi:hypothetical protein